MMAERNELTFIFKLKVYFFQCPVQPRHTDTLTQTHTHSSPSTSTADCRQTRGCCYFLLPSFGLPIFVYLFFIFRKLSFLDKFLFEFMHVRLAARGRGLNRKREEDAHTYVI